MEPALDVRRSWPVEAPPRPPTRLPIMPPQEDLRTVRVDLTTIGLGLAAPPCSIQAWFMLTGQVHRLLVLCPPGRAPHVARWLAAHDLPGATVEPGIAPRSLWIQVPRLPQGWRPFVVDRAVQRIEMTPEGTASLFVEDTEARVEALLEQIQKSVPDASSREAVMGEPGDLLTARQKEVLAVAVASGYYEVPRRITLRGLASTMGLSPGATSELLRRGERTIISGFFDSGADAAWAWDAADELARP